jgi:hypothetical protein
MKKILITEQQLSRLIQSNSESNNSKFSQNVETKIDIQPNTFNGGEILGVESPEIPIFFDINIEYEKWGIGKIDIINVKGPSKISITVTYDKNDVDDEETIEIPLDWKKLNIRGLSGGDLENEGMNDFIGIDDTITIGLGFQNNNIFVHEMILYARGINNH